MTTDKFNASLNSLLSEGRISHVINVLRRKCEGAVSLHPSLGDVMRRLDAVADTYSRLRQYLFAGNPDPGREKTIEGLKDELRSLGRRYLFIVNEDRLDPLFAEYRMQKVRGQSLAHLVSELSKTDFRISMASETEADVSSFIRRREDIVENIFRKVWSLPPDASADLDEIKKVLSGDFSFDVKSQIISALLLGLLKFFDPRKFSILLDAYESASDERIAARSLTAVVLVLSRWGRDAVADNRIQSQLRSLEDSILTYARLKEVVMTLIRTRDTDRVSREVNDAFNSTMRHISPEMLEKLQKEGLSVDAGETGLNPEWEKLMENSDIEEKMQNINDMQLEGMDVMMQTFSRLKSFPFFNSVANWFLPFSTRHSLAASLFSTFNEDGFTIMADATEMCAGDRFSFILGIMQMPEDKRNMLASSVNASLEMMRDHNKDRENVRRRSVFATEALSYARDIYRFAKLFPRRRDFFDPFEMPVDFLHLPLMESMLADREVILECADFYFNHGYYSTALPLFAELITRGEADRDIFEKTGYCFESEGDYSSALENYEKADLFSSDADRSSLWLLKKLAFTSKALGRYGKAAEHYRRALERNPEDLKTEFHLGSVLLRAGDVNRGKELISKVHYLDPEHKICNRIYNRLKGHEAFVSGNFNGALRLYEEARGDQEKAAYRRDLQAELLQLYPDSDRTLFQILLDF